MKLDRKFYGQIRKIKDDTVVPEEEWVCFLAKDTAFAETLPFYRMTCVAMNCDPEQIAAVDVLIARVSKWRAENPGRLKRPDARGERLGE